MTTQGDNKRNVAKKPNNNLNVCLITTNTSNEPSFIHIRDSRRNGKNQATFEENIKHMILDNNAKSTEIIQTATDSFIIFSEKPEFEEVKVPKNVDNEESSPNDMDIEENLSPLTDQEVLNTPNEMATFIIRRDSNLDEVLYGKCVFVGSNQNGERTTLNSELVSNIKSHRKYFKSGPAKAHNPVAIYGGKIRAKTLPQFRLVKGQYMSLPESDRLEYEEIAKAELGNDYKEGSGFTIYHKRNRPDLSVNHKEEYKKLSESERNLYIDLAARELKRRNEELKEYVKYKPPTKPSNVKAITLYEEHEPEGRVDFKELPKNHELTKKYKEMARQINHNIKVEYQKVCRKVGRKFNPKWAQDIKKYNAKLAANEAPKPPRTKKRKRSTSASKKTTRGKKSKPAAKRRKVVKKKTTKRKTTKRRKPKVISETSLQMEIES